MPQEPSKTIRRPMNMGLNAECFVLERILKNRSRRQGYRKKSKNHTGYKSSECVYGVRFILCQPHSKKKSRLIGRCYRKDWLRRPTF
jgi:hypothetical protein